MPSRFGTIGELPLGDSHQFVVDVQDRSGSGAPHLESLNRLVAPPRALLRRSLANRLARSDTPSGVAPPAHDLVTRIAQVAWQSLTEERGELYGAHSRFLLRVRLAI